MIIFSKSMLLLWAVFCQLAWAENAQWPKSIVVITSNQRLVSEPIYFPDGYEGLSPDIEVLSLDAVADLEQQLSQGLPADEAEARRVVEQRFERIGRGLIEADIRTAYKALGVAMKYGVNRYPAIIFDHRAVVYGLTDVLAATTIYAVWLEEQREVSSND